MPAENLAQRIAGVSNPADAIDIRIAVNALYDAIYQIAEKFDQDCIAVRCGSGERGWLVGPRAHEWGEFDPTKFLLLDGSRAA